ncbi:hemerythrin domain-containing protein [Streptomyces sp. NPDC048521]|uniref:hemerythrin domain-containing protein n=1 Tax=Streptomyces sp. NPDC048521 TaxID=3365566 RepID=UPI003713C79A
MDAPELPAHDHRVVEQLFRDYDAAASDRQRRGVVELLVREPARHAAPEEMLVHPTARKVLPDGAREVDEHRDEHPAVQKTLLALDRLEEGDRRTDELVAELRREVAEHIRVEEGVFMPRSRGAASPQDLDGLGELIGRAKKGAPTRPHPNAPDTPPALTLAAPSAAAYDRLRDRLQRRPQT